MRSGCTLLGLENGTFFITNSTLTSRSQNIATKKCPFRAQHSIWNIMGKSARMNTLPRSGIGSDILDLSCTCVVFLYKVVTSAVHLSSKIPRLLKYWGSRTTSRDSELHCRESSVENTKLSSGFPTCNYKNGKNYIKKQIYN